MRRKFLTWLFFLICAAFAVAGALAFAQFQRQAKDRAEQIMMTRINDLLELVCYTQENMQHVMEINEASTLERTRALAEIIRLNPNVLTSQESLQGLANDLGASRISVTDEKGTVIAAVPASSIGYEMAAHEQSRPFLECIDRPGYELCQRPHRNEAEDTAYQYAGVHRLDKPGIVQLGFNGQHEQIVRAGANFGKLAANFKLGRAGHIIAFYDGKAMNREQLGFPTTELMSLPSGKTSEINLNDTDYFAYVASKGGIRLVGLLPMSEMTEASLHALQRMMLSSVGLFIVEFILVWLLLQKLVLNGISRIDKSLRRIAEGYPDERVSVRDCPEFTRLSTGINSMVDSLQAYGEMRQERLKRELELAKAIQSTVLPNKFPPFPEHPEFDLYATCMQANVVGGDFYDFFMPDAGHVCFLVGDVNSRGIPAALFMMRAISIIRELSRTEMPLAELVATANQTLCEGGSTGGMRLSLFYGRLDIASGRLSFVNAGTPQTLLQHTGMRYELLPMNSGLALGGISRAVYLENRITLEPGDRIFCYTEGVLGAMDALNTPFGESRLEEALQTAAPAIADVPRNIRTALKAFCGDAEQNTDITMLAFEYRGKRRNKATVSFTAGAPGEAQATLESLLESVFAAPVDIQDIRTSLSTILAALPPDCPASLLITCDEQEAQLTLTYRLERFNPLISLPHLPIDKTAFTSTPEKESVLTLWKRLA